MTTMINPVDIIWFIESTFHDIFEHLLAINSKNEGLLSSVKKVD